MNVASYFLSFLTLWLTVVSGKIIVKQSSPFSSVISCIPITLSVVPSRPDARFKYSVRVEGPDALHKTLRLKFGSEGILMLTLSGDLFIQETVRIVVRLPATMLKRIEAHNSIGMIVVDHGFDTTRLQVIGSHARVIVSGIKATDLAAAVSGSGVVFVDGNIQRAYLRAIGVSNLIVKGITEKAQVEVGNVAKLFLIGDTTMKVEGRSSMVASIYVDKQQTCDVTYSFAGFLKRKTCRPLRHASVPAVQPHWTSKLSSVGPTMCILGSKFETIERQLVV